MEGLGACISLPQPVPGLGWGGSVAETLVLPGVPASEKEANEPDEEADKYKQCPAEHSSKDQTVVVL